MSRGQDQRLTIEARMAEARSEMDHWRDADFLVLNDNFDRALGELLVITDSLRLGVDYQARNLSDTLAALTHR